MPRKSTIKRARKDARQGKSPSTQAGEFVRKVIHAIRQGKHGARNSKQAIAIGLSEARQAGIKIPNKSKSKSSKSVSASSSRSHKSSISAKKPSSIRSKASLQALKREPRSSVSKSALSQQARSAAAAKKRTAARSAARRRSVALKAARTRKRNAYEARV